MSVLLRAAMGIDAQAADVLDLLRQFQSDTATLLRAQIDRIDVLQHEIILLREEIRTSSGSPPVPDRAEPLNLDLRSYLPSPPSDRSATWLLEHLNDLEVENRSTWKDLLGRISSTITHKSGRSILPNVPKSGNDAST